MRRHRILHHTAAAAATTQPSTHVEKGDCVAPHHRGSASALGVRYDADGDKHLSVEEVATYCVDAKLLKSDTDASLKALVEGVALDVSASGVEAPVAVLNA